MAEEVGALRTQLGPHAGRGNRVGRYFVHLTRARGAWWAVGRPHSLRNVSDRRAVLTGEQEAQRAQLGFLRLRLPYRAEPYAPRLDARGLVGSGVPQCAAQH